MTDNKNPSINLNGAEIKRLAEDALKSLEPFEVRDIVARMQETINRQQEMIDALIAGQETLQKALAEKNAEIERLQNECFCIANERDAIKDCIDTAVEEAKTEATEQLSKKIESRLANNTDISNAQYQSIIFDISEASKEMVGE